MKYNVGDLVRIKSINWYNKNKSKSHGKYFELGMKEWCDEIMTIIEVEFLEVDKTCYIMKEDGGRYLWTDEMIEELTNSEIAQDAKTFSEGYDQGYEDAFNDIVSYLKNYLYTPEFKDKNRFPPCVVSAENISLDELINNLQKYLRKE